MKNKIASTLCSISQQDIPNWDILFLIDIKLAQEVKKLLNDQNNTFCSKKYLKKISFYEVEKPISEQEIKIPISEFNGEFIGQITAGDTIPTYATYFLIKEILTKPNAALLYSDYDHISKKGRRSKPFYKPKINIDLLFAQNYLEYISVISKNLLKKISPTDPYYDAINKSSNYLKILNYFEEKLEPSIFKKKLAQFICHVPNVLYHRNIENGNKSINLINHEIKSLRDYFNKKPIKPNITHQSGNILRLTWPLPRVLPLVSIIIPTKNHFELLKSCIESITKKTLYKNYEIIIIDNNSDDKKTLKYLESLSKKFINIKVAIYKEPFNYSKINNFGVNLSHGEILCFLNNDIEVISPNWLTEIVSNALRKDIGVVGVMLYYSDKTIQHAGVILGLHSGADHAFRGLKKHSANKYFNYLSSPRNVQSVTGAVLGVEKSIFNAAQGFDEIQFPIEFNDVDLCLKIELLGYRNLWTPHAELIHHESKSRNAYKDEILHHNKTSELNNLQKKWGVNNKKYVNEYLEYNLIKQTLYA